MFFILFPFLLTVFLTFHFGVAADYFQNGSQSQGNIYPARLKLLEDQKYSKPGRV